MHPFFTLEAYHFLPQDHDKDERGERNRTGETSGRRADMDCHGLKANGRAARELGEVDELFSKLRKKLTPAKAQPSKVRIVPGPA